jgi:ubiquinone/menaquinone biosynthesis C-methylase UbiE
MRRSCDSICRVRPNTDPWDAVAAGFDDAPDHGLRDPGVRAAWARRLEGWLPSPPADVLDLGCGTGSMALLAVEAGHRVVGVDRSARMVELARVKLAGWPAATVLAGDAADPPVAGRTFGAVLVRHMVWALPDPRTALRRWVRLLEPGGRLVLIEGRWRVPNGAEGDDAWAGLTAETLAAAVAPLVARHRVERLPDPALWGRPIDDERYALLAER